MMHRTFVLGVALVAATATAIAGGSWSDKLDYRYSNTTSLKVTDPDGFKVTVVMPDGNEKADTVPALFQLPDQDAYVKVTLTSPDGAQWSKKIEIRSKQQAQLALAFKADAAKPDGGTKARRYTGKILNQGNGCGQTYNNSIKAEFLRASDGQAEKEIKIDVNTYVNVELPGGKYDVRVFVWSGSVWDHVLTSSVDVAKDAWAAGFGCKRGSKKPTLLAQ
jgi:hypothetical protein